MKSINIDEKVQSRDVLGDILGMSIEEQVKIHLEQEKKDIEDQTWPIWLSPIDFKDWYIHEQKTRKNSGRIALPDIPADVIKRLLSE